ncbi:hypothetical protein L0664_17560 [Octadecabacter sp. G9-8]|uniref:Uncharacterized protein n=1 Tax=Octadecabacter dasysiphoniae TaxID=2909341 RepID=A0ABS9D0C4_9RHOB|nr:hypothetical protein [Octadecabacter dasysiphoniae]MCF2872878.1 hypothetical protein [Octadecabacter dasysiphoniae]
MHRHLVAAMFCTAAVMADAQELDPFFTEELGGVYTQDWSGRVIGPDTFGGVLVFVYGGGKSGDFYGVLSVDCTVPERSQWVSTGGVIGPDRVPMAAISVVRANACGSP